jgi:molecular chaperone GrpE
MSEENRDIETNEENIQNQLEETQETTDTEEVEEVSVEEKLQTELQVEKDKFLRLFAEFENYKKRTSKERIELFKTAGQDVISSLLPVLDDLDRGIIEVKKVKDKETLKGLELISNKLKATLTQKGLEKIKVKEGDVFDAEIHEAITQIPAPNKKLVGKIIDTVETGYRLGDKIIRYPKVVVGK